MTPLAWGLAAVLVLAAAVLFWRWRRAETTLQAALDRLRTVREQAEALEAANANHTAYLASLAQADGPALFLVDGQQTVQWINDVGRDLCVEGIVLPIPLSRAVHSFELLDLAGRALEAMGQHERQFTRDGRIHHAQAMQTRSQPRLALLVVKDVTELQRLGRARRDFVANISHDLRTPITAIQLMVETLQGGAGADGRRRNQLLAGIGEQTAAIEQLAQEMLDLSLIESGRMPLRLVETPVADLIEPVRQRMQPQAEPKGLRLAANYDQTLQVLADPDNVRRALQNLVHNAIKFTPAGGAVTVGATDAGEDVRFWVQDTGVGIDPDDLPRIFERFYKADRTRSESGTGLGLAIARHIVEAHGGRIWAESVYGKGATFYFTLPRA
jgi:two-component system phosphate regulon sensor histidine kinase PhoR